MKEFTKRRKCSSEGLGLGGFSGNEVAAEQDVSARPQLGSLPSLGAGSGGHCGLVRRFASSWSPGHLQDASGNFLAPKIKSHKTVRVKSRFMGSS